MFNNIGGKIKTLAVVVFVLGIITSVILAVEYGKDRWGDFAFGLFLLILIPGCLVSYLSVMTLYGFGQLIENSDVQTSLLESLQKQQSKNAAVITNDVTKPKETMSSRPSTLVGDSWVCKKCGSSNPKNSLYCRDCGEYR